MNAWVRVWIVPGGVFQSVIVGGGYGSGREVAQWLSVHGAAGGLAGALLMGLFMGLVLAATFDLAYTFGLRDYRSFFQRLVGPGWLLYEVVLILGLILLLAVASSVAGEILADSFGWPVSVGVVLMLLIVTVLAYCGREWVAWSLTFGGLVMSALLIAYGVLIVLQYGDAIVTTFRVTAFVQSGDWSWAGNALQFALYSVFVGPLLLYSAEHIASRRQAWGAGLVAGLMGALPAVVYHVTFMAEYPSVLQELLPTWWMIQQSGISMLMPIYVIVLFGTIAQTGVGVLHGINERLDAWWQGRHGRHLTPAARGTVAGASIIASLLLAKLGIVALVAKGFGSVAWVSLGIYVVPLLTVGLWMVSRSERLRYDRA